MRKMFAVAIFLISLFPGLVAAGGEEERFIIVQPQVLELEHEVSSSETLWSVCAKFYGQPTPGKVRALADYNHIPYNAALRRGQKLKIPMPLIRHQKQVGVNPTQMPLLQACRVAWIGFKQSLDQADIHIELPADEELFLRQMAEGIRTSATIHQLNGELAASVTYLTMCQNWTQVEADVSGPSVIMPLPGEYAVRVTKGSHCRNIYIQLLLKLPPPVPQVPESKPPIIIPERPVIPCPPLKPIIPKEIPFAPIPQKEWKPPFIIVDASTGGTWQDYTDNAEDYSHWAYGFIGIRVRSDSTRSVHRIGPFYKHSGWHGTWSDQQVVPGTFIFRGKVHNPGLEYRFTKQKREHLFRLGYLTFNNFGHLDNVFGRTEKRSDFKAMTFEYQYFNMSRFEENWWPRWKIGGEYLHELSSSHSEIRFGADGSRMFVRVEDRIEGIALKADVEIYSTDRRMLTFSLENWGKYEADYDRVGKISLYAGFLNNSIKFGLQQTFADYGQGFVYGIGPSWQFHANDFYWFVKTGGFKKLMMNKEEKFYDNPWQ